jgi:coiled-coil domain-containing protein 130
MFSVTLFEGQRWLSEKQPVRSLNLIIDKYYPPSWDPSKGSLNRFVGQHPLRARAAKAGIGIIVVRFEMPFNVWCLSCEKHIGQGTRYNAEKKKIGYYFSSPIYSFKMTCHLCSGPIEIHTDPKLGEYIIKEGLRKRVEEFSAKDAETIDLVDDKTREKIESDPFFKLEHGLNLKEKVFLNN